MAEHNDLMDKVISLCKRRGFVYQSSEIYGGIAGFWDYGPMGTLLKENVKALWLKMFRDQTEDVYGLDSAIINSPKLLEASGHVANFGKELFKTEIGTGEETITSHLRAETAQGIFANFKNVLDSMHPKLPFGIAQIGKAFRNEISPRDFIFRVRELEQMEVEYFVKEDGWEGAFEKWRKLIHQWIRAVGIDPDKVHELEVPEADRAHYSKRTIDFEFDFPFGRKELYGLAYRTDFDLRNHGAASGASLEYLDEETGEKITPHVVEPSLGVDRTILALLVSAYAEDEQNGEVRTYLKLPKVVAPIKAAVFPLLKNKPELVAKAKEVLEMLRKEVHPWIAWDDNGNIGKRYRRQDEIGTPYCVTIDFDTLGENPELLNTVTLRDRDTGEQKRVKISDLKEVVG